MRALLRLTDLALGALAILGELAVAAMCIHIVAEIAANELFRKPIEGTTEIVARWYMVAIVFLPLGLIHRRNRHIKAELFTDGLGPFWRRVLEIAIHLLMAAMAALFFWYSWLDAADATARAESVELMSGTLAVWPTRWLVPAGFGSMALVALLSALRWALEPAAIRAEEKEQAT
jgi:TRAP-type C4-dicarboxylate transport system permease small subunit